MECTFFKGTKTLKYISNKKTKPIHRDFEFSKSEESVVTDQTM